MSQEAKKVSIDQDLVNLLSETPGRCVPYAVIEGMLGHVRNTDWILSLIKILIYTTEPWTDILHANFKKIFYTVSHLLHTAGVVRTVKESLNSQFVENCKGVIERLTLKEEKMVWNRTTHLW